jgi:transposase
VEIVKRGERRAFTVLPRRWIVERAFAQAGQARASLEKPRAKTPFQIAVLPLLLPRLLSLKKL